MSMSLAPGSTFLLKNIWSWRLLLLAQFTCKLVTLIYIGVFLLVRTFSTNLKFWLVHWNVIFFNCPARVVSFNIIGFWFYDTQLCYCTAIHDIEFENSDNWKWHTWAIKATTKTIKLPSNMNQDCITNLYVNILLWNFLS